MAEGQDEARVQEIRARHYAFTLSGGREACFQCIDDMRWDATLQDWPCDTAHLLARLDALTAERDEINAAVREHHEAALEKLEGRVTHWMGQRDKFCDQLADEKKSHARTQEWLDKFQSEAATQQVRAIKAEQALTKAEAERDDALARLAAAEAAGRAVVRAWDCDHQGMCDCMYDAMDALRAALAGSREQAQGDGE